MRKILALCSILTLGACVDRIFFEVDSDLKTIISISGHISNQPGPYQVDIFRLSDIDSKDVTKQPINVAGISISDNTGYAEDLIQVAPGSYQTVSIQGEVGRIYKVRISFLDGAIIESLPDTLLPAGNLRSMRTDLNSNGNHLDVLASQTKWGFDIYANASSGESGNIRFLWTCRSTFRLKTIPEADSKQCYPQENGFCNFAPLCSGIRRIAGAPVRVGPCTCCICWYDRYNSHAVLSDNFFSHLTANEATVLVDRIPLSPFLFFDKVRVEVGMKSLTTHTHRWWEAVYKQAQATGSLFQPISGKIPQQFVNVSTKEIHVQGIFYACGVSSQNIYLTKRDVPSEEMFGVMEGTALDGSCLTKFPNATTVKPAFWID